MSKRTLYSRYKSLSVPVKIIIWFLFAFLCYTAFGFWGVPRITKYVLEDKISPIIKRNISISRVTFNPYTLEMKINGLRINDKNKKFFKAKEIILDLQAISLIKRALILSVIKIDSPKIYVVRSKKGVFNFSDLLEGDREKTKEKEEGGFKFSLNNIEISHGTIIFEDRLKDKIHKVEDIKLGVPFISNIDQQVKIYVKPYLFAKVNGSPFEFQGKTRPFAQDRDTSVDITLKDFNIPYYLGYIPDVMGLKLTSCKLDTDLTIHFLMKAGKTPRISLDGKALLKNIFLEKRQNRIASIKKISLNIRPSALLLKGVNFDIIIESAQVFDPTASKKEEPSFLLNIPKIELKDNWYLKKESTLLIPELEVDSPRVSFKKFRDGRINLVSLVDIITQNGNGKNQKGQKKNENLQAEKKAKKVKDSKGKFRLVLNSIKLSGGQLDIQDFSYEDKVVLSLCALNINIDNFDTYGTKPFNFKIDTKMKSGGSINIDGISDVRFSEIKGFIKASKIFLPSFQGYLSHFINLQLVKAELGLSNGFLFKARKKSPVFKLQGSLWIKNCFMFDEKTAGPFVKWKEVKISGLNLSNEPMALKIKKVDVIGLKEHMIILPDRTLNFARIFKRPGEGKKVTGKDKNVQKNVKKQPEAPSNKENKEKRPDFAIDVINLKNCMVHIEDRSVHPRFLREFNRINGVIKGISNRPDMKAFLNITALVDNRSKMEINGELNPLAKPIYADIRVRIEGAGVTRFSPYSQKFLGYKIDKGKLYLKLHITIKDNHLRVDNNLLLDQFELGQEVESKDAINAPIKLAIAILKDRNGKIDLNIPVSGRLDDPEFSYGSAVFKAILNIFIKAATSPFALLGAVVGSDEQLDRITFEPGLSKLDDKAIKKLDTLAKALKDRPSLRLDITGFYDPEKDKKALLEIKFQRLLKRERLKDLSSEDKKSIESIDDIEIPQKEYEKYLEAAYKNASFKRPRNFIGLIKSQPPEVMEKMLKDHIKIMDEDLKLLSLERAKKVASYLVHKGGIDIKRIFMVAPKSKDEIKEVSSPIVRLSLK